MSGSRHDAGASVPEVLRRWAPKERVQFARILEVAKTELQRELIRRVVLAKHSSVEVRIFADTIRSLSDGKLLAACRDMGPARPFAERLRLARDPLLAFLENGFHLVMRQMEDAGPVYETPLGGPGKGSRPELPWNRLIPPPPEQIARPSFDLGQAGPAPSRAAAGVREDFSREAAFSEELFNVAVAMLGLRYRERAVDSPAFSLEHALREAQASLARGWPVPVVLGAKARDYRRYALLLQVQQGHKSRAFQLYDPLAVETAWANELDLLARRELPLKADERCRRITAVALPYAVSPSPQMGYG